MSDYATILVSSKGASLTIKINRPEAMNALNFDVLEEIEDALLEELDPEQHRVVILEGSGDKAFVAGADIEEMKEFSTGEAYEFSQLGQSIGTILATIPMVTIAKVKGFALGGGCELAMACDIIIAGRSAKFGQPEVNLGLIPGFGGTQRLVKRVGLPLALDMLLTGRGRTLSADEALQAGLVSRVVDDANLDSEIAKVIEAISKTGSQAVAETKRLARDAQNMNLASGLAAEATSFGLCFGRDETKEGIAAFLAKRTPNFSS